MKKSLFIICAVFSFTLCLAQSYSVKFSLHSCSFGDFEKIMKGDKELLKDSIVSENILQGTVEDSKPSELKKTHNMLDMLKMSEPKNEREKELNERTKASIKSHGKEVGIRAKVFLQKQTETGIGAVIELMWRDFQGFIEYSKLSSTQPNDEIYPVYDEINYNSAIPLTLNVPAILNSHYVDFGGKNRAAKIVFITITATQN